MTEYRRLLRLVPGLLALSLLAACGNGPADQADRAAQATASRQPAELVLGDLRISASVAPTAALSPVIADRYGVTPDQHVQLLLVGLRQGPAHDETPVQAQVAVRVRDLRGVWQEVAMREVRSEGFIDYVGSVRVAPPDTLAFEVTVRRAGTEAPEILRFSRDVLPR